MKTIRRRKYILHVNSFFAANSLFFAESKQRRRFQNSFEREKTVGSLHHRGPPRPRPPPPLIGEFWKFSSRGLWGRGENSVDWNGGRFESNLGGRAPKFCCSCCCCGGGGGRWCGEKIDGTDDVGGAESGIGTDDLGKGGGEKTFGSPLLSELMPAKFLRRSWSESVRFSSSAREPFLGGIWPWGCCCCCCWWTGGGAEWRGGKLGGGSWRCWGWRGGGAEWRWSGGCWKGGGPECRCCGGCWCCWCEGGGW